MGQTLAIEGGVEVSDLLRPGIYVLGYRGVVVYVGKGKVPLVRVYTHRNLLGRKRPAHVPLRGIQFDQVWVIPCKVEDIDAEERRLINRYKPRYNVQLKTPQPIEDPLPESIKRLLRPLVGVRRV